MPQVTVTATGVPIIVIGRIKTSTGPLADFQTLYFGPEFSGLVQVRIPTYGWSLDNLVVTIPEPSAGGLLFLGAVFGRAPAL